MNKATEIIANRRYILLVLIGLIAFLSGILIGGRIEKPPVTVTKETRETTVDTISYRAPIPQSELASGTHSYTMPVYRFLGGVNRGEHRQQGNNENDSVDSIISAHNDTGAGGEPRCSTDSAMVELPIIQRHYADSTYEAWISGPVDPRLDSLRVIARTTTITKREWKPPKRWHIGLTAGYGYGPKGFQPYIGVGITYSIISF